MPRTIRIVIPWTEDRQGLRATIDSILETTRDSSYEILVSATADPGEDLSFLGERAYAERVSARIDPEGMTTGRRLDEAVRAAGATHCVFLETHCLVSQPDWLQRMIDAFERHPDASMVQPEVVELSGEGGARAREPDGEHDVPTYSRVWTWPYEAPSMHVQVTRPPASEGTFEAMAGTGACTFVRSATFLRLGGFDPEMVGLRALTMDYCLRAWMLGAPTIVDPHIQVRHHGDEAARSARESPDSIHAVLKTAYKYFTPRRRDIAETSLRAHDLHAEVERALARIHQGAWLRERVAHERARQHDDDWLFEKFFAYEARYAKCE